MCCLGFSVRFLSVDPSYNEAALLIATRLLFLPFVEGTIDYIQLLFPVQLDKVNRIT